MVSKAKVFVMKSAGTNCDEETRTAFELAGALATIGFAEELFGKAQNISRYHIIVFPGGFSYGDDIAAGKVWATEIKHFFHEELQKFISQGNLVLGICNGFQVLVKLGLLPSLDGTTEQTVSLTFNDSARYEDRWVHLRKCSNKSVFINDTDGLLYMPIAHAEGKFIVKNQKVLNKLFKNNQVIFQYTDRNDRLAGYPANPNGSLKNIAGICDPTGRVLGMMPHPERAVVRTHYPNWRRHTIKPSIMGMTIIQNCVNYIKKSLLS
ncbi:MAG: phosphoribosylformylglycinamidine synthase I [Candidatus Cloacimonadota bacterium]|nr:MAG: phosphoribosylformylglycinamidine synthase I [Candidatus Cloacimonadota bacterium]